MCDAFIPDQRRILGGKESMVPDHTGIEVVNGIYAAIPIGSVFMLINQILVTIYLWKGEENA